MHIPFLFIYKKWQWKILVECYLVTSWSLERPKCVYLLYLCIILGAQAEKLSINDFKMILTSLLMVLPRLWRRSEAAVAFFPGLSIKGFQSSMSFQGVWMCVLILRISDQYECSGLNCHCMVT